MAQNSAWNIVKYYSKKAIDKIDMSNVSSIGIDEISVKISSSNKNKKGHKYITVFANASNSNVLYVTNGKTVLLLKDSKIA